MMAPAIFIVDLFAATRSRYIGIRSLGVNPAARSRSWTRDTIWLRICHSSDGILRDYGAATSEGLIVRSIHRHCQFRLRVFLEAALCHCPLVKMWWASLARMSAGRSTFSRWSRPRRRCLRRRRRGSDCRLSRHETFSDDTCANTAPISEVGGRLAST